MVQVVDYQEFKATEERLRVAEAQLTFLTGLLLSQRWLTRAQTMLALNVSESTLHRLTRSGKLTHRYEGSRPLYCMDGLRAYLSKQRIEGTAIDQRLITASVSK
jgi:hypothetical protein